MAKQPDLASAVHDASGPPRTTNRKRRYTTASTRDGTKGVLTYVRPPLAKQLRRIALEEDTTMQALGVEALEALVRSRGQDPAGR